MNEKEKALIQKVIGDIDRIADALENLVLLMMPIEDNEDGND
mgnify:FL=1